MDCQICGCPIGDEKIEATVALNTKFSLCQWHEFIIMQFIQSHISNSAINIFWGAGRVCWSSWFAIRDILRQNNIKEVLEFGSGLSSELFVNEGMTLVSCDVLPYHIKMLSSLQSMKGKATFYHYPDVDRVVNDPNELGHFPDFEKLYPGKKWDFVFVDGPQERYREVKKAMELSSKFIYLHDPNMGEQGLLPNDTWKQTEKDSKLYVRN